MHRVTLVGGTQYGAAQIADAAHPFPRQPEHAALWIAFRKHDAVEAFPNSVTFPTPIGGCDDHGPYHGIQTGGVAPARADRYASNMTGHGNSCFGDGPSVKDALSQRGEQSALDRIERADP